MFIDLGKALSFLCSLLSLYWVAGAAFFSPWTRWQDRMVLVLLRLILAAAVCFMSCLLFRWPVKSNPDAGQQLLTTLPVKLFFWAAAGITLLFFASWYLVCQAPCLQSVSRACPCRV